MFDASTLEVFIASTNDLADARTAVEEVLRDWNSRNAKARQIMLKPIRWEKDTTPELGPGSFQAVINKRLLDPADILVGIVGKRLGSPTAHAVAGTVEEIERFARAKKPVLLYFSDEPSNLSQIDTDELARVNEFRKSMQQRGLYLTFNRLDELKQHLHNHLDTLLQDFKALLIPAGKALAYGYFRNFVEPTHTLLRGGAVDLPDSKSVKRLSFKSFRIRIAKPASLDDATDNAAFDFKKQLRELSLSAPSMRRAFRVYLPEALYDQLNSMEHGETAANPPQLDELTVIDFPTPLIALNTFVQYVEASIVKTTSEASGYWERQKNIQYTEFFTSLRSYQANAGIDRTNVDFLTLRRSRSRRA